MADYPISNVPRRVQYVNTGVGPYLFNFEILTQTDIAVYRGSTLLTLTTDYTVTINSNGTGSITLTTAGTGNITIVGARAIQRTSDYTTNGDLFANTLNTDLDSQTIYSQQIAETADRSIKVPVYAPGSTGLTVNPEANKVLGWDSTGANLINIDAATIATIGTYATAYADVFVSNGSTVAYTLTRNPGSIYNLDVSIEGVTQEPIRDYTLSGSVVTFTSTIPNLARILIKYKEGLPNVTGDSQDIRYLPASGTPTTVQAKLRETVSVKDFGAVGDGVADDTTAFINAATAAAAQNKSVYAPGGIYKLTSTVLVNNKPFNLVGDGIGVTYVTYTGTTTAFDINPTDVTQKVSFKNLTLAAANLSADSGTAISINYPTTASWVGTTVEISNLDIRSNLTGSSLPYWDKGIVLDNCWNGVISNVWFSGEANSFTGSTSFIELGANCTDFIISNCHGFFCTYAVLLGAYSEGVQINNCVFVTVNSGIYDAVGCLATKVTNTHINAEARAIAFLAGSQQNVSNNLLYCAYPAGVSVVELDDVEDSIVQGNFVFGSGASCSGITLSGASGRNNILDNNIQTVSTGVWLKSTTFANYAKNNKRYTSGVEVSTYLEQGSNVIETRSYSATRVITLTGGAAFEDVTLSIPSYYFFGKPSVVYLTEADTQQDLIGFYEYGNVANSATSVVVKLKRRDGGTISAGGHRFSFTAFQ